MTARKLREAINQVMVGAAINPDASLSNLRTVVEAAGAYLNILEDIERKVKELKDKPSVLTDHFGNEIEELGRQ